MLDGCYVLAVPFSGTLFTTRMYWVEVGEEMLVEMTKSVTEIFDTAPPTDSTETFEQLWSMMSGLADRVKARFELELDPSVAELAAFGDPEGNRGMLTAFSGPKVDWMIHSWLGDPAAGFTNMHLTVWLGPDTNVPHLGMAWGTLPSLWCFIDLIPRADLLSNPEYVDRYYEPANEAYMALKNDPGAPAFVSQDTFTRAGVSQSAFCTVLPNDAGRRAQIEELANLRLDQWLGFLDAATPTTPEERPALAERDLLIRKNIAERDPANQLAERFYGKELTNQLIRSLWGGDRALQRPTGS
jgi:hypothetical protein